MKHFLLLIGFILLSLSAIGQTEKSEIRKTLLNYINGTSYNQPQLIEKAFYGDANLYLENKEKKLWIVPIKKYKSWYENKKTGFNGRIGNIISIDHFNTIATAKAEIILPKKNIRYVDLFLLKKIEGEWKIISKAASKDEREVSSKINGDKILFILSNASFYGTSDLF